MTESNVTKESNGDESFDWSAFWQRPERRTMFDEGPLARSYAVGRIEGLFRDAAEELRDGDGVVDVGCGKGAGIASLAAVAPLGGRNLRWRAVDSARVTLAVDEALGVELLRGEAERLPLPDQSVKLVLSCFGFEFFDRERFVGECCRVLTRDGSLALLIYAEDAWFVRRMARYVEVHRRGLGELIERVRSGRPSDAALRTEIQAAIDDLGPVVDRPDLERLVALLAGETSLDDGTVETFAAEQAQRFALWELILRAAVSWREVWDWCRDLAQFGFRDVRVVPAELRGWRVGWWIASEPRWWIGSPGRSPT